MANIRNIDYGGFDHATGSAATGSGFMIWSGSMQLRKSLAYASQTTQYYGVGIEAIAHSGSYFRFQTDTDGNQTQGGALAMNLQLNVAPYNTAASATKPISDILFPLQGVGELARATIIINVGGVTFEEDDVATGIADMSK